jgi:hypothetical protein
MGLNQNKWVAIVRSVRYDYRLADKLANHKISRYLKNDRQGSWRNGFN